MTITITRKRPEHEAKDVLAEQVGVKVIDKRFTSIKAAATEEDTDRGASALMRPTDEELDKINNYTRSTKTADDVVVLRTMSANDIRDRDLDKFKTPCIKKFATLPEPYSSTGKSFMVGHDTSKLPMGRIFDVGTKRVDDNLHLTNSVYMPNTEQYKNYLESVDFGIFWAVSVGVMIGTTECTVGKPHEFMGHYWCSQGHEKGLHYDPESDEMDSWGWPLPVEEGAKGAVLCACDFDDPTDFYELSQVYLGAQYFAELGKDPQIGPVIKSASTSFPIIGLKNKEAERLSLQHLPERVVDARKDATVLPSVDGDYRWQDDKDFIYAFDPEEGEIICLGRSATSGDKVAAAVARKNELQAKVDVQVNRFAEAKKGIAAHMAASDDDEETDDPVSLAESVDATLDSLRESMGNVTGMDDDENFQQSLDLLTSAESSIDSLVDALGGTDPDDEDDDENSTEDDDESSKGATAPMSKKAVQAAARAAKLPSPILDKLVDADDDTALSTVLSMAATQISTLEKQANDDRPMVEAGSKYIEDLRTEVKSAYIRSKQLGENTGVNTDSIEKLIKLAGNDIDLLKSMADEFGVEAKDKIGSSAVIRSTFPADANKALVSNEPQEATNGHVGDPKARTLVERLHG